MNPEFFIQSFYQHLTEVGHKSIELPFCICAVHQLEGFSWDYEAPNVEFYRNSTQTAEFLKVFLSLLGNMWSVIFQ